MRNRWKAVSVSQIAGEIMRGWQGMCLRFADQQCSALSNVSRLKADCERNDHSTDFMTYEVLSTANTRYVEAVIV